MSQHRVVNVSSLNMLSQALCTEKIYPHTNREYLTIEYRKALFENIFNEMTKKKEIICLQEVCEELLEFVFEYFTRKKYGLCGDYLYSDASCGNMRLVIVYPVECYRLIGIHSYRLSNYYLWRDKFKVPKNAQCPHSAPISLKTPIASKKILYSELFVNQPVKAQNTNGKSNPINKPGSIQKSLSSFDEDYPPLMLKSPPKRQRGSRLKCIYFPVNSQCKTDQQCDLDVIRSLLKESKENYTRIEPPWLFCEHSTNSFDSRVSNFVSSRSYPPGVIQTMNYFDPAKNSKQNNKRHSKVYQSNCSDKYYDIVEMNSILKKASNKRHRILLVELVKISDSNGPWSDSTESNNLPRSDTLKFQEDTLVDNVDSSPFVVGCVHLPCSFQSEVIQCCYSMILSSLLYDKFADSQIILAGDFNMEPHTLAYKLFRRTNLSLLSFSEKQLFKKSLSLFCCIPEDAVGKRLLTSYSSFLDDFFYSNFKSSYVCAKQKRASNNSHTCRSLVGSSSKVFSGCLDYIFFRKVQCLKTFKLSRYNNIPHAPNQIWPSDHFQIGCTLKI